MWSPAEKLNDPFPTLFNNNFKNIFEYIEKKPLIHATKFSFRAAICKSPGMSK